MMHRKKDKESVGELIRTLEDTYRDKYITVDRRDTDAFTLHLFMDRNKTQEVHIFVKYAGTSEISSWLSWNIPEYRPTTSKPRVRHTRFASLEGELHRLIGGIRFPDPGLFANVIIPYLESAHLRVEITEDHHLRITRRERRSEWVVVLSPSADRIRVEVFRHDGRETKTLGARDIPNAPRDVQAFIKETTHGEITVNHYPRDTMWARGEHYRDYDDEYESDSAPEGFIPASRRP